GLPILEVIKRMEVQDLVVVVTRYFGGTLLGAAGLIRAYSKSASLGIEAAVIVKRLQCRTISLIVEYTMFGKLQNFITSNGYVVKDVVYGQDVEIQVHIPVEQVESFIGQVIELSNDRIVTDVQGETYITVDDQGNLIKD
ncbi:MAG TPA: YigZ family protein, partial [Clostridia bacterium]|nr:YigZ family protein [Clostridia bacterium]